MFSLPAEALARLDSIAPTLRRVRRPNDPVKLARRRRRLAAFDASIKAGLRHSRRTPVHCT